MTRSRFRSVLSAGLGAAIGLSLACYVAPSQVASRYVKSVPVQASQGATLSISEAESPELAGTTLVIEPGALTEDQTITVELGFDAIVPQDSAAAGPVAVFGPAGLVFTRPARLTLPYRLPEGAQSSQLFVQIREGDGALRQVPNAELEIASAQLSLDIGGFTSFQPGVSSAQQQQCSSNQQCPANHVCVNGHCQVPDAGNVNGACQTTADCSNGQVCLNLGVCSAVPQGCNTSAYCEVGDTCVNGQCVTCSFGACPVPDAGVDGGNNGCQSNADCSPTQVCLNNGLCSAPPVGCNTTAYCPMGEQCVNGVCTGPSTDAGTDAGVGCQTDFDCSPSETCTNGTCTPAQACNPLQPNCPSGTHCYLIPGQSVAYCRTPTGNQVEGQACTATQCLTTNPTPHALYCSGWGMGATGICREFCDTTVGSQSCPQSAFLTRYCNPIPGGPAGLGQCELSCTSSSQCGPSQQCVNGSCQAASDAGTSGCTSHGDCPSNKLCLNNGLCGTMPGGCNTSAYCPINTQCVNGQCQ